jgi:hypothetical protein
MKRAISSIIFGMVAVMSFAQGSFTIVRPFDGAKVREVVRVLMPKNSIPDAGYVGVFLNGDFKEAVDPKLTKDGKYYEYMLDSKSFDDGNYKLELKLYVDYSSQPRIVDTSSIDITIANKATIPVPEDGVKLRYNFSLGGERIYRLQQRVVTNLIGEKDQQKSTRAFQIQQDGESFKMLYACDNIYGNGEGLIRMQIVPDKGIKGREYSFVTTSGASEPKKFYPENMAAVYMRLSPTGREVFGTVPAYFGIDNNTGFGNRTALFASFPLPVLPSKAIRPGDSWQTTFQQGALDMSKIYEVNSVIENVPARGEFVGVEWEMGHPCAKIKNSISQGAPAPKGGAAAKAGEAISGRKYSMEETIWFALDTRTVVKFFRDITVEGKIDTGGMFGSGGGSGGGAPAGGGRAGGGGDRGGGARSPDDFEMTDRSMFQGPPPGVVPGGRQGGGRPGGPAGFQGPGGGPPGPGGGAGMQQQMSLVRQRVQYLFVLEK